MTRRDIITAVPVAFHDDGSLDLAGSRRILQFVAASGVDGGFVMGTTGEFVSLTEEERLALTTASIEELSGIRPIVHIGAASAFEVLRLLAAVQQSGGTEAAVLTPYYLPATDDAIVEFYETIAARAEGVELYVYVFQARTGNAVSAELLARLSHIGGIIGAKVSGESLETVAVYRQAVGDDFRIYTGSDADYARAAEFGADGVVSGVASVLPEPFIALREALESANSAAIDAAQSAVNSAVALIDGDMARIKYGLSKRGVCGPAVRMPIEAPDAATATQLDSAVTLT